MKNKGWNVEAVAKQPSAGALAQCIVKSAEDDESRWSLAKAPELARDVDP